MTKPIPEVEKTGPNNVSRDLLETVVKCNEIRCDGVW